MGSPVLVYLVWSKSLRTDDIGQKEENTVSNFPTWYIIRGREGKPDVGTTLPY